MGLASELRQVLSNLVGNAIDAMKKGGRLLVRTREATWWNGNRTGLLITIADTGTGMSQETLRKLYKAFSTTKGLAGTGLGLWISSEIVSRHHGHLKVRSSERSGDSYTVFQLFLPFQGAAGSGESSDPALLEISGILPLFGGSEVVQYLSGEPSRIEVGSKALTWTSLPIQAAANRGSQSHSVRRQLIRHFSVVSCCSRRRSGAIGVFYL